MFIVSLSNKAVKQYRELEPKMALRADSLFKTLEERPIPAKEYDLLKLAGANDEYRIRLSSYRVSYKIFWQENAVRIAKIERRDEHTYG